MLGHEAGQPCQTTSITSPVASVELLGWNGIEGAPSSLSNPLLLFGDWQHTPTFPGGKCSGVYWHRCRCCSGDKSKGTAAFRNRQPLRKTKFFEGYQLLILLLIWLLILGFGGIPQQVGSSVATSTRRVVLSWILDKSNIQLHFLFPKYLIYVFYMILI